jgi:dihydrofolate reductase
MPNIALIAAVADNGVIGCENRLPWRLKADLQHFRSVTMDKPVIMGRRTYESLPGPLRDRKMHVITSRNDFQVPEGVVIARSLQEAIDRAVAPRGLSRGAPEVVVIGGAQVFAEALPLASRLYLTWVHADVPGDTFFPDFDASNYVQMTCDRKSADADNEYTHTFMILQRSLRAAA